MTGHRGEIPAKCPHRRRLSTLDPISASRLRPCNSIFWLHGFFLQSVDGEIFRELFRYLFAIADYLSFSLGRLAHEHFKSFPLSSQPRRVIETLFPDQTGEWYGTHSHTHHPPFLNSSFFTLSSFAPCRQNKCFCNATKG